MPLLFVAPAGAPDWPRYQIVMWHNHGPAALAGARALGVTAGMVLGVRAEGFLGGELERREAPLRDAGLGLYVENIATDVYAAYHRWQPDHPLTWLMDRARARHAGDPADLSAFVRQPSLSDPATLAEVAARLRAHVRELGSEPLYYSLGDETGIADLTAAWDFDFSGPSLVAFREWLRGRYPTPEALNREWGTRFVTWTDVRPMTTDAALQRRDSFAGWMDFKAFMDAAFAAAIRAGTDAVHDANPQARAAIEGAQAPGWGGYDYTTLATAVDVMEIGGADHAQEIAQALNPSLITLTTISGEAGDARKLWQAALAGGRGAILWDPDAEIVGKDGSPGPRWSNLSGVLGELGGKLGAELLAATPEYDAVGILYSPPSFRLQWLLDRQADGKPWAQRSSEDELGANAVRTATSEAFDALAHRGLRARVLSPSLLENDGLAGLRAVILPHALCLSDAAVAALAAFAAAGGTVLADIAPGAYDDHGRRRAALPSLPVAPLSSWRSMPSVVAPAATLAHPDGTPADDAMVRVLRHGATTMFAVLRDPGPGSERLILTLPQPQWLRDLRGGTASRTATFDVVLDGTTPALILATPEP